LHINALVTPAATDKLLTADYFLHWHDWLGDWIRENPNPRFKILLPLAISLFLPSALWQCWLGTWKSIRPVKIEWWSAGMVICTEWGASDLYMVQLMPLLPPPIIPRFVKIQTDLTFLVPSYPGCLGKEAIKSMCVYQSGL